MNITKKMFKKMYNGSWYTITGADLETNSLVDWVDGYKKLFEDAEVKGLPNEEEWVSFTGKEMNNAFKLTGTTRYTAKQQFLAFPIDKIPKDDVLKLSLLKMRLGDRWFDDIVDNNTMEEREKNEDYDFDWED